METYTYEHELGTITAERVSAARGIIRRLWAELVQSESEYHKASDAVWNADAPVAPQPMAQYAAASAKWGLAKEHYDGAALVWDALFTTR